MINYDESRYVHGISQKRSLIYCSLFQYQLIGIPGYPNLDRQPDKGPDLFSQKTSWRQDRAETWISEWSKAHLKRAKEKHQENEWITISAYKQLACQYELTRGDEWARILDSKNLEAKTWQLLLVCNVMISPLNIGIFGFVCVSSFKVSNPWQFDNMASFLLKW